jgi:hypothetical protein
MNWISVINDLPKCNHTVLVWSTLDNDYALGILNDKGNWHCQCLYDVDYFTRTGVSHWMEMPKVPEIVLGELIGGRLE